MKVFDIFTRERNNLFAVLDAARDPQILPLLKKHQEDYQSLYQGKKQQELAEVAPYLVYLPPNSNLLTPLLEKGWGKNWGIYLTTTLSLPETRKQLRRFLIVQTQAGRELYFRFYDPRVWRRFLPTCNQQQLDFVFQEIISYLVENDKGEDLVVKFTNSNGLQREEILD